MASSDLERQCDGAVEHGNDCFIIWICFIYFGNGNYTWKCDGHYSAIIWCHLGFRSPPYAFSTNRFSLPFDFLLIAFSKWGKIMSVLHWPTKKKIFEQIPDLQAWTIYHPHKTPVYICQSSHSDPFNAFLQRVQKSLASEHAADQRVKLRVHLLLLTVAESNYKTWNIIIITQHNACLILPCHTFKSHLGFLSQALVLCSNQKGLY